ERVSAARPSWSRFYRRRRGPPPGGPGGAPSRPPPAAPVARRPRKREGLADLQRRPARARLLQPSADPLDHGLRQRGELLGRELRAHLPRVGLLLCGLRAAPRVGRSPAPLVLADRRRPLGEHSLVHPLA